jgi:PAS domain S-box-containing protein
MSAMHRLMARQLKRTLGIESPEQAEALLAKLSALADREPELARALRGLPRLLEQVSQSYDLYDRDISLASRSLEISSSELLSANATVLADNQVQQRTLVHLRDALRQLAANAGLAPAAADDAGLESLSQRLGTLVAENDAAQRALQASEAKFRALTSLSTDWFWEQDAQLRFVTTSGRSTDRGGLTPQAHVGLQRWDLPGTEPTSGDWSDHRACLEAHQPFHDLLLRRTDADGGVHYVEVNGAPLFDAAGRFRGYHGTARDVSARMETEQALREAKQAADAASAAKSMFLANMSHELRTPLNGMLGNAELMLDEPLSPAQRERARMLMDSGRLLLAIINDILDFSKIEAGHLTLDPTPFDLRAAVDEVTRLHRLQAEAKGLDLRIDWQAGASLWLLGDSLRLRQVLGNLVSNAIKFTARGEVLLHVQATDMAIGEPSALRFEVRDTGQGIPDEAIGRLFQPFTQADAATTRLHGGTGLGLAICRRIVDLMGGTIRLDSQIGQGTTVSVELSLTRTPAPAPPADGPVPQVPLWLERRVLLVEDNAINRLVASTHLERLGLRVTTADDGLAALAALEREPFDLVFMDCQMPRMDGFEAVAQWRRLESERDVALVTPIVAMTANNMSGDRERTLEGGFDDHLGKPFTRADLSLVLSRWLGPTQAT